MPGVGNLAAKSLNPTPKSPTPRSLNFELKPQPVSKSKRFRV